ncbi:DUF512 domain-containing protein [bacterium]|nr:DUF512 domain-containing protein [bacterium]
MPAIINSVENNSIAQELELEQGDKLLSIDGMKMKDLIDYNFYCKSELITLEIERKDGSLEEIEIEKEYDEDLGIIFESAVFDKIKPCMNKCIFCFVDQQPKGLRDTLYIKDDDYRLSYLQGTYITLTNLTQKDKERIETLRLGPFYVSLHTTNPDLRVKMLKNPNAKYIMNNLKWLESIDIPVHIQIVLCPGYNDGKELERTFNDLKKLKNILSVAVVPLGITKFRKEQMQPVTEEVAKNAIMLADNFNEFKKQQIACCSDEMFALAKLPVPQKAYYGEFCQLDDGVGALRMILDDFSSRKLPEKLKTPQRLVFATGKLAKIAFDEIAAELNKIENLTVEIKEVSNKFWGDKISVAGLVTYHDLVECLRDVKDSVVVISGVMLRPFTEDFLDGKTLTDLKNQTGLEFLVVKDFYSTKEIVDYLFENAG